MNISKALKFCRNQRGLSKTELAKKADISISYLTLLEQGKRDPNFSVVDKLCGALNIPMSIFIFLATDKNEIKDIKPELANELAFIAMQLINNEDD